MSKKLPTEAGLDKKRIIAELTKSAHGDLSAYLEVGRRAALQDPDFFAHLVAWNHVKGQVRDAKIALPVIALLNYYDVAKREYIDNALAHLGDLRPQDLRRVFFETKRFDKAAKKSVPVPAFLNSAQAPKRLLRRFVTRYLRDLEQDRRRFEYAAVLHHKTLRLLYWKYRISCPEWVSEILYHAVRGRGKWTPVGIFEKIHRLHEMPLEEAAGTIVKFKIPFLVARGALGARAKEPDAVLALLQVMTPSDLVTNTGWLEKVGVKTNPALRAAFEAGIGRAAASKTAKVTLKTTRAAEALADDAVLSQKLNALQEKQLEKVATVDGDWLVLGDKSGSMESAIDMARDMAATLSRMVTGKVHLVFFDTMPFYINATGKTLEELKRLTRGVTAGGATSIGCGLRAMIDRKVQVDGIAIISDGGENNNPQFGDEYARYVKAFDTEPTVYLYQTAGESDVHFRRSCVENHVDVQVLDIRGQKVDYYSMPNIAQTMRVSRYSLLDEIMATPLRHLDEVLDKTVGTPVLPRELVHA